MLLTLLLEPLYWWTLFNFITLLQVFITSPLIQALFTTTIHYLVVGYWPVNIPKALVRINNGDVDKNRLLYTSDLQNKTKFIAKVRHFLHFARDFVRGVLLGSKYTLSCCGHPCPTEAHQTFIHPSRWFLICFLFSYQRPFSLSSSVELLGLS